MPVAEEKFVYSTKQDAVEGFVQQLAHFGLTKWQINDQNLPELEKNLEKLDQLLQQAEEKRDLTINGHILINYDRPCAYFENEIIVRLSSQDFYRNIILPTLLKSKKVLLARVQLLEYESSFESFKTLFEKIDNKEIKYKLLNSQTEFMASRDSIKKQEQALAETEKKLVGEKNQHLIAWREKKARLDMEFSERRAKILMAFLERESVATIVGAALLIVLTLAQLLAMFLQLQTTDIINNSLLLILGYFFGQAVVNRTKKEES